MVSSLHSHNHEVFRGLLIKARRTAQLTQAELAQKLDMPQSFVSKYEIGERRLDFVEFIQIAEILGIDLQDFINKYKNLI